MLADGVAKRLISLVEGVGRARVFTLPLDPAGSPASLRFFPHLVNERRSRVLRTLELFANVNGVNRDVMPEVVSAEGIEPSTAAALA